MSSAYEHLIVVSGSISISSSTPELFERQSFLRVAYEIVEETETYRYGFQGQEKDDELKGAGNSVNYTYRMHDPRLGRFFAVDPLAHKFAGWSPYNAFSDNPIRFVDPDGRAPQDIIIRNVYKDSKGKTQTFSVEYKNGKLYTESGKLYTPLKGGYLETVRDQLNTIKSESERGKNVISRLEYSNNDHIITNDDYERPEHRDKGNYNLELTEGSTITKYDAKNRFTVAGTERNPRVGLIHELTHAYDQDRGANNYFTTTIRGVKLSEIHAVNVENTVRAKTGDPKRIDYGGVPIFKPYLH